MDTKDNTNELSEEEIIAVQKMLAETVNDPNLTIVTTNHFTNELMEKMIKEINDKDGKLPKSS